MKELGVMILLFGCFSVLGQETIYSCGKTNQTDFNGWKVQPFRQFSKVSFDDHSLKVSREIGGFYTLELEREIKKIDNFEEVILRFASEMHNVSLNRTTVLFSNDQIIWQSTIPLEEIGAYKLDANYSKHKWVKLQFELQFFDDAWFKLESVTIEGRTRKSTLKTMEIVSTPNHFYKLFAFKNQINLETNTTENHEVIITNLSGQIIHRQTEQGSHRIVLGQPTGYYLVLVIANGKVTLREKVFIKEY